MLQGKKARSRCICGKGECFKKKVNVSGVGLDRLMELHGRCCWSDNICVTSFPYAFVPRY